MDLDDLDDFEDSGSPDGICSCGDPECDGSCGQDGSGDELIDSGVDSRWEDTTGIGSGDDMMDDVGDEDIDFELGDSDFDSDVAADEEDNDDDWDEDFSEGKSLLEDGDPDEDTKGTDLAEDADADSSKMDFSDTGSSASDTGKEDAQPPVSECMLYSNVRGIAFSEGYARLFKRGKKFLLMESDFEAVYNFYNGNIDGYSVLHAIAEHHNLPVSKIVVMLTEGEIEDDKVKINKAKPAAAEEKKPVDAAKETPQVKDLMTEKYKLMGKADKTEADKERIEMLTKRINKLKSKK
jgi:hypothetical protein